MILQYNLQFFAKDGPGGEKTEEPTSKKLSDARNEGQVAKSKEVTSAFEMLAAFLMMRFFIQYIGTVLVGNIYDIYSQIPMYVKLYEGHIQSQTFRMLFVQSLLRILQIIAPFLIVGFLVAFITNLLQVKWKVTTKPLKPKFSKLNPVNGFKRFFFTKLSGRTGEIGIKTGADRVCGEKLSGKKYAAHLPAL